MTRSTPLPPLEITRVFPALSDLSAATVRLHPQRTRQGRASSKVGGSILWPPGVDAPRCELHALDHALAEPTYLPVIQLRRSDIPELPFPDGTDVFQVLWCGRAHDEPIFVARCAVYWWSAAQASDSLTVTFDDLGYRPEECSIEPERVLEFPNIVDLPRDLRSEIVAWEERLGKEGLYEFELSTAPGTKVGGYPNWIQEAEWPSCPIGHRMDHLLTIDDSEFDGGTYARWLPVEDQAAWEGPDEARLAVQNPTGLSLMGSLYLFVCSLCPGRPVAQVYQR